jgi:phage terminase small subunit
MARTPDVEKPPGGLKEPYLGIWRYALKHLKESDLWRPTLRPLLDEYAFALRTARAHRLLAETTVQIITHYKGREDEWIEELPPGVRRNRESDLDSLHPGFASADREIKRAIAIAAELGITPKAQQALVAAADAPEEPDAFTQADELTARRTRKAATA